MKAMLVAFGAEPELIEVEGLEDLQKAVGGYIDAAGWIFDDKPTVYLNDEGKLGGFPPNRAVYARKEDEEDGLVGADGALVREGDLVDIIFGDFVCIGFDPIEGEDRDISQEECEKERRRFGGARSILSGMHEATRIANGL